MNTRTSEAESANGEQPPSAWLGLGSNLGRRAHMLTAAIDALQIQRGLKLLAASSVYETDPVGVTDQPLFLNMVVQLACALPPEELLEIAQTIERALGRERSIRWGPRVIDIDLLIVDGRSVETEDLILPLPDRTTGQFVLVPLAESAPELPLPGGHTAAELARPDCGEVQRLGALKEVLQDETA